MKYYVDQSGRLGEHRRAATGGLIVEATLAKTGVLVYTEGGKQVRHLNTEQVLASSLAQIPTAPVTNRHPSKFVDTTNYTKVAAGHVVGAPEFVDGHLKATLAIHDEKLIRDIELGTAREVSMGYHVEVSDAPGITDSGEAYDVVRETISWNHIAIVPQGRAGKTVRLLLDSSEIPPNYGEVMYKIDGKEVAQDAAQAAFDAALAATEGRLELAKAEVAELKAKLDAVQAELVKATSDETIDAAVSARLEKKAQDEARAARLEAVKKAFPKMDLTGKSQDAIDALFEVAKANDDPEGINLPAPTAKTDAAPQLSARERMLRAQREALGKPTQD